MVKVKFTQDCEIFQKGEVREFSRDIANELVNHEKVAEFTDEPVKIFEPKAVAPVEEAQAIEASVDVASEESQASKKKPAKK